ncbi:MAG: metal ABC transporter permease [Candidatus Marinimicrobia bacterium]|nr:metal ABC transporter permease [FCB group bacterium]MBL7025269.1 metal ABC transporter permease [Candidatus Neomarinimicrobiota bacterium]
MEYIEILLLPFMAAFVLTGIQVYLGLHIVTRGVIFVDLALAQVAALGMAIGVILGLGHESVAIYFIALLFTILGAGLFTLTREIQRRFTQEAIIGIVYVVSAALMILLLSKLPEGGEHLNHLLVGSILFVSPEVVLKTAGLYALIGLFHYRYREAFLTVSKFPGFESTKDLNTRLWDFIFYVSFGLVVTSAVQIAGILLVFSYLIIPAVAALIYAHGIKRRLIFGWAFGVVGSLLGLFISVLLDLPTGASIVAAFGTLLIFVVLFNKLRQQLD